MGKSTISMAIFNSYFDITRGYVTLGQDRNWAYSMSSWRFPSASIPLKMMDVASRNQEG